MKKCSWIFLFIIGLGFGNVSLSAAQTKSAVAVATPSSGDESLSGIELYPSVKHNSFVLEFNHQLKEPGTLTLTDKFGEVLFSEKLEPNKIHSGKAFKVGMLDSGEYTISLESGQRTYWKTVRIRK